MKLIADSGSTKTDWCLVDETGIVKRMTTQGINPIHQTKEEIREILKSSPDPSQGGETCPPSPITHHPSPQIFFYGSGVTPLQREPMCQLLCEAFPEASEVTAESDLLGAARALCQHQEGVACILGTGANSCLYDGQQIVKNTPALGYILGDEGSGAVLGIRFLNALYKGALPDSLRREFETQMGLSMSDVINRVYRQPLANRWLASLSTFIHSHVDLPEVSAMVTENFRCFIRRNVLPYGRKDLPLNAVGSIAWHYRDQLQEAAEVEDFTLGTVVQSPMDGLISYHLTPTT